MSGGRAEDGRVSPPKRSKQIDFLKSPPKPINFPIQRCGEQGSVPCWMLANESVYHTHVCASDNGVTDR